MSPGFTVFYFWYFSRPYDYGRDYYDAYRPPPPVEDRPFQKPEVIDHAHKSSGDFLSRGIQLACNGLWHSLMSKWRMFWVARGDVGNVLPWHNSQNNLEMLFDFWFIYQIILNFCFAVSLENIEYWINMFFSAWIMLILSHL